MLMEAMPHIQSFRDATVVIKYGGHAMIERPTLLWWNCSDDVMLAIACAGFGLSVAVALGLENALVMTALWALYMSIAHVGQIFYGYGWEILLLEAGFLAIFFCPLDRLRPFSRRYPPPEVLVWMLRWLTFRLMFGAGLIKLRGDACWRDLTCLEWHYETQPLPNPLSWLFHRLPSGFHAGSVLFNHFVELLVPFALFLPRPWRSRAAVIIIAFQFILILSGNLSMLNWLSIVVVLGCFDDGALLRAVPKRLRQRVRTWVEQREPSALRGPLRRPLLIGLSLVIGFLSIEPAINLLSPRQRMNASFNPLHIVNTYGAFGAVGKERHEIIIEGTAAVDPTAVEPPAVEPTAVEPTDEAKWVEYEFKCKPGDVDRRPCAIAPYHYRLDWQVWFAAMSRVEHQPWLIHLVYKLLRGDAEGTELLEDNPFPEAPPRWIRIEHYRYRFTDWGEAGWWKRERIGSYMRAVSLDDPTLLGIVAQRNWNR